MTTKIKSARTIIIRNKKILLMHRIKEGRDFYTLIGGKIEKNETPTEAIIREVKEETSLNILEYDFLYEKEDSKKYAYYFLIEDYGKLLIL